MFDAVERIRSRNATKIESTSFAANIDIGAKPREIVNPKSNLLNPKVHQTNPKTSSANPASTSDPKSDFRGCVLCSTGEVKAGHVLSKCVQFPTAKLKIAKLKELNLIK